MTDSIRSKFLHRIADGFTVQNPREFLGFFFYIGTDGGVHVATKELIEEYKKAEAIKNQKKRHEAWAKIKPLKQEARIKIKTISFPPATDEELADIE